MWYDGVAQARTRIHGVEGQRCKVQGASMYESPSSKRQRFMAWTGTRVPEIGTKLQGVSTDRSTCSKGQMFMAQTQMRAHEVETKVYCVDKPT